MKAVTDPISHISGLKKLREKQGKTLASVTGVNRSSRAPIMQYLRGDEKLSLVITFDEARAEKLVEDYRFYDKDVFLYPAKDVLFYYADIHGNVTGAKRLEILKRIHRNERTVIVTTIDGVMDRLPDMKYFRKHAFTLSVGDEAEFDELKGRLIMLGYEHVSVVEARGQFSVRGGILDIFPLTEECPCRVEFFGDEIESIRYFDSGSQRSIEDCQSFDVLPASEYVLSEDRKHRGIRKIEEDGDKIVEAFRSKFETEKGARLKRYMKSISDDVLEYNSTTGLDSLVTYFFGDTVSFLDYLPEDVPIFIDEPERVCEVASARFKEFTLSMESRLENGYILPKQADVMFSDKETLERLALKRVVTFAEFAGKVDAFKTAEQLHLDAKGTASYNGDFNAFVRDVERLRKDQTSIIIVTSNKTRGNKLRDALEDEGVTAFCSSSENRVLEPTEVMITTGFMPEGFRIPAAGLYVTTENEIFGTHVNRRKSLRKKFDVDGYKSLDEIDTGDYVVHERHGIGIYRGIEKVEGPDGTERDYINIDYADGGRLFIPVEQLSMIGRYAGKDAAHPKLSKLGGTQWNKAKSRAKAGVEIIANDLAKLYAARQTKKGYSYSKDTVWQKEFEDLFPYEETNDQYRAIVDTKADMESDKIMDRLICGDVGFGKTEVAIRAAFKAVQDGRQVAYLVPTTILAEQHFETFTERMKNYPVNVRMLSRFCTTKQIKENIEGLKNGSVDIVIGTHRILSKDVQFKSLGLLIIDEEQRFGVKHKEAIKQLKNTVDVLTLTATPIPRTLHMSMVGIRDISLLEEPPVDRRPIQTFVMEYDREIVKEAINRELARGGQAYYVFNQVDYIAQITSELSEMIPGARIQYAHGKMNERELEDIMRAFINKEIDVLVSTTIIETGLDIPNVNTIIIHNADRFGLAQLYQLRGRVGRSDRAAYAFLMYKRDKVIREVALKRLSAIREFTELGSGYKISMKDLEIRGAGNVLGSEQSGHLEEIGYDLYVKLLRKAVKEAMGEEAPEDFDTSVDIPVDAYIPDDYIKDEFLKLEIYKRISHIENEENKDDVVAEAEDRFGEVPKSMQRLLRVALIRARAHSANLASIRYANQAVQYIIRDGAEINVDMIPELILRYGGRMKLVNKKDSGFLVTIKGISQDALLDDIEKTIDDISSILKVSEKHTNEKTN